MPTIRLGDADRERWGCSEALDAPMNFPIRDAAALEDAGGNYLDWFKRDTARGFQTYVWLALYRAGIVTKLDELVDLDLAAIRIVDDEAPGKAPSSANGSGRTRATSASSTGARRRTSKT